MEKAMHQSHGIGYAEYNQNLDERLRIEQERDKEYSKSNSMVDELQRQVHAG